MAPKLDLWPVDIDAHLPTETHTQHTHSLYWYRARLSCRHESSCCASKANLTMKLPSPSVWAAPAARSQLCLLFHSHSLLRKVRQNAVLLLLLTLFWFSQRILSHRQLLGHMSFFHCLKWQERHGVEFFNWPLERTDMNLRVSDTEFFSWAFLVWTE